MTPILKAYCTDMGFEAANLGMQCYGGHGYIRENGVEQFVRDARINMVYEGANGVQAMDLVGRKLGRKGGAAPMALFALLTGWIAENEKAEGMAPFVTGVKRGTEALQAATLWLAANGMKNPDDAGAGATDAVALTSRSGGAPVSPARASDCSAAAGTGPRDGQSQPDLRNHHHSPATVSPIIVRAYA